MYGVHLCLIKVVQQPAVGVYQELSLCIRPGDLFLVEDGGILRILSYAVLEHRHQVCVGADVGVFAPQNCHKSTKYNFLN